MFTFYFMMWVRLGLVLILWNAACTSASLSTGSGGRLVRLQFDKHSESESERFTQQQFQIEVVSPLYLALIVLAVERARHL